MGQLKRGAMFVVLLLFLVGFSGSVLGDTLVEGPAPINPPATTSVALTGQSPDDCASTYTFKRAYSDDSDSCFGTIWALQSSKPGLENGCVVGVQADEYNNLDSDDDCGAGVVPYGAIFGKKGLSTGTPTSQVFWEENGYDGYPNWDGDADSCFDSVNSWRADFSWLCTEDVFWKVCHKENEGELRLVEDPEFNKNKSLKGSDLKKAKAAGENLLVFQCVKNTKGQYAWIDTQDVPSSVDQDEDGTPDFADCAPNDDTIAGEYPKGCLDNPKIACFSEGVKAQCGNGIDEDCSIGGDPYKVDDNCDNEKFKSQCVEQFSWLDGVEDGNFCCGDSEGDLGVTQTVDGKKYVCLSSDSNLVGVANGDVEGTLGDGWAKTIKIKGESGEFDKDVQTCQHEWCWVKSDEGGAPFQILTLKEKGVDLVSNKNDWYKCNATTDYLSLKNVATADAKEAANRFYCYKEGGQYSWADCRTKKVTPDIKDNGAKNRFIGDGLFALPVSPDWEDATAPLTDQVDIKISEYENFYGDQGVSFKEGNVLEFYLKFDELAAYPENPIIKIYGPNNEEYFSESVLSYAVGNPLLEENNWIRISIPVQPFVKVQLITIATSLSKNKIKVRNARIISSNENILCSGEFSKSTPAWFEDGADLYNQEVSAETMCNTLYGKITKDADGKDVVVNAWMGDDLVKNNCCGNQDSEYYAGSKTGCWNSVPVVANESIGSVSFEEVKYFTSSYNIGNPDLGFIWTIFQDKLTEIYPFEAKYMAYHIGSYPTFAYFCPNIEFPGVVANIFIPESLPTLKGICSPSVTTNCYLGENCAKGPFTSIGTSCPVSFKDGSGKKVTKQIVCEIEAEVIDKKSEILNLKTDKNIYYVKQDEKLYTVYSNVGVNSGIDSVNFEESPKNIDTPVKGFILKKEEFFGQMKIGLITTDPTTKDHLEIYFENKKTKQKLSVISDKDLQAGENIFEVYVKTTPVVSPSSPKESSESVTHTYACFSDECYYPLTGLAPYTLKNPNPNLYDLYFKNETSEYLITKEGSKFNSEGNVVARKVARNIVLEGNDKPDFYGCEVPTVIANNEKSGLKPANYCNARGGYFCAYSEKTETGTTVNTWSKKELENVGYDLSKVINFKPGENIFLPKDASAEVKALPRNHSSSILPARNLISNSLFITNNGWNYDGLLDETEGVATITDLKVLKTERIAIPQNEDFELTYEGSCKAEILLANKDGTSKLVQTKTFSSETYSFLEIIFTGQSDAAGKDCTLSKPMLQIVDEVTAEYYEPVGLGTERTGISCCPQNYCWNGNICVEPMGENTFVSETIPDGRNYRCIAGEWSQLPVKKDWNEDKIGFCKEKEECFVLNSEDSKDSGLPSCIAENGYVFDHYCEEGNWTSRTKFVASALQEGLNNEDYVIYCSDPQSTLVHISDSDKPLLLGTETKTTTPAGPGGAVKEETKNTCFTEINNPLIGDDENTCVNNVCVVQYKKSGDFVSAFATTMNNESVTENILKMLKVKDPTQLNKVCQAGDGFVKCKFDELAGDLYFNKDLNAIVYAPEGLDLNGGNFWSSFKNFFKGFFGISDLSKKEGFSLKAQNFNELYLLQKGDKNIVGIKEIINDKEQAVVLKYEGFKSPLCDYIDEEKIAGIKSQGLSGEGGEFNLVCNVTDSTVKIEARQGLDILWKDLTASLRVD